MFSTTQPKTTKNSEKQTSQKLGHPSRVVLPLHWVQFLAVPAACASISTALMCWRSVPGLLPLSSRSAAFLWAWFGWAPFGSALWAQLGWGHSPPTPFSLAASMPALFVQHYCGFVVLPLFSSPCLVTVFQRKRGGGRIMAVGPRSSEADLNTLPLWRQNGALLVGRLAFPPRPCLQR